uniref:Uncharacterized protein n=1 Tax=Chromera velia CCMP2878 TaxID=1169474 RepID=A0A0G4IC70_9ALVE|eukprot:Cvel_12948.t1-p1 / transcript=Cvel_12948.t1 / gene=Cvel_12948 / organism=Chromera_velia_CCMP2878 / gene_product=hypothetical protein / transcript_product=hypothetical protein / location=Cvel_scaffold866:46193-49250(-) / protein_length=802 / sequence_SO=supercontig / SO=protein_coding / is_pseudo=false
MFLNLGADYLDFPLFSQQMLWFVLGAGAFLALLFVIYRLLQGAYWVTDGAEWDGDSECRQKDMGFLFEQAASIADITYQKVNNLDPQNLCTESFSGRLVFDSHSLRLVRVLDEGGIWIFKCAETCGCPSTRFVVGIRGTDQAHQFVEDARLLADVACDSGLFKEVIADYQSESDRGLLESGYDASKHELVYVGHSLGAAVAEALALSCYMKKQYKVQPICIDTPGTPPLFRDAAKHLVNSFGGRFNDLVNKNIRVLNSTPNLVNTLTKPISSSFWTVGGGSNVGCEAVMSLAYNIFWKVNLQQVIKTLCDSHKLVRIRACLRQGELQESLVSRWPTASGSIAKGLWMWWTDSTRDAATATRPVRGPTPPQPHDPPARDPPPVTTPCTDQRTLMSKPPTVPRDLCDVQLNTVYLIEDRDAFAQSLEERNSPAKQQDVIVTVVGLTGMGKTTLLESFLRMQGSNTVLPKSVEANCTKDYHLIRYKQEREEDSNGMEYTVNYYVLDQPGLNNTNAQPACQADVDILLSRMMDLGVSVALFVSNESKQWILRYMFTQCYSLLKGRVGFVYNRHLEADNEQQERRGFESYKAELMNGIPSRQRLPLVAWSVKATAYRPQYAGSKMQKDLKRDFEQIQEFIKGQTISAVNAKAAEAVQAALRKRWRAVREFFGGCCTGAAVTTTIAGEVAEGTVAPLVARGLSSAVATTVVKGMAGASVGVVSEGCFAAYEIAYKKTTPKKAIKKAAAGSLIGFALPAVGSLLLGPPGLLGGIAAGIVASTVAKQKIHDQKEPTRDPNFTTAQASPAA